MKTFIALFTCGLLLSNAEAADTLSSLAGKGPQAADRVFGKPARVNKDGSRDYDANGYGYNVSYDDEGKLSRVRIDYAPKGALKSPEDISRLIGPGTLVEPMGKKGVLEMFVMTDNRAAWEAMLTPGVDGPGYSLVNLTLLKVIPAQPDAAMEQKTPVVGQSWDEVLASHGKPRIKDADTGWAYWPAMKVKFVGGKAAEIVLKP